jgi:uncharacterized protein (DUF1697 family)
MTPRRTASSEPRVLIGLLRAVNLGGTSVLPMKQLSALCTKLGFANVRTCIASGNVVFATAMSQDEARTRLEEALAAHMGRPVDVFIRDANEMRSVMEGNPFPDAPAAKVHVLFCASAVPAAVLQHVVAPDGEEIALGARELYIHYPNGMGRSKLKLPSARDLVGTARNMNTVRKLVEMTG